MRDGAAHSIVCDSHEGAPSRRRPVATRYGLGALSNLPIGDAYWLESEELIGDIDQQICDYHYYILGKN
jgi:hypothetical protein